MVYGKAVEKAVASAINERPSMRAALEYRGDYPEPDFRGVGAVAGLRIDVTMPRSGPTAYRQVHRPLFGDRGGHLRPPGQLEGGILMVIRNKTFEYVNIQNEPLDISDVNLEKCLFGGCS